MAVRLNIAEFVADYCGGLKDRDLIAKHELTAKEMIQLVKRLIKEGQITRQDYFDRNRKIEELETLQEKDFIKSLHHCPVCSHIHPTPFTVCPACGADVSSQANGVERKPANDVPKAAPARAKTGTPPGPLSIDPVSLAGQSVGKLLLLEDGKKKALREAYTVGSVVSVGPDAALCEAEPASSQEDRLLIKFIDPGPSSQLRAGELVGRVLAYQAEMSDPNILKVAGKARVGKLASLVYEYMPATLDSLIEREPAGLPYDQLNVLLPQILNAVGYSHLHRGLDGMVRRLPHLRLAPSKFLFDPVSQQVKLDECGLWRAMVDLRGHSSRLWEDPGVDLSALGPEGFVLESRSVNGLLADIYALGVTLYKLTTGVSPFEADNLEEYRTAHLKKFAIPPRVHRYDVPKWLDHMIMKCLEKEPSARWRSATQMEIAIGKDVFG
jgi:hypothetical protein